MALIQIKRGPSDNLTSITLSGGEPAYTQDTKKLYIGNDDGTKTLINPDLNRDSIGLGNVDNTSDINKPISKATQAALDNKVELELGKTLSTNDYDNSEKGKVNTAYVHSKAAHAPTNAQENVIESIKLNGSAVPLNAKSINIVLSKADVGLGNVDNTSDINKPISSIVQAALNNKANLDSPSFSGIPTVPTAPSATSNTQIASTAFVKAAINNMLAASDAMMYKGTIGTGGTVVSLPASHKAGDTYKVISKNTYAGNVCEVGDMIICITTGNIASDAHWTVVQSNIDGAVICSEVGVTADTLLVFSGTSGRLVKGSGKKIISSIDSSANIPTANAVKSFIEAKGYLTGNSVIDGGTF